MFVTSNLADDMLAMLMIGFVLATQEWLSMLGKAKMIILMIGSSSEEPPPS